MSTATTTASMTPRQYLAQHELTLKLKRLGIKQKQLDGVRFNTRAAFEFRDWIAVPKLPWPENLFLELRVWCALRWLILDNPGPSRDRRDAWDLVAVYLKDLHQTESKVTSVLDAGRTPWNSKQKTSADSTTLKAFIDWEERVADAIKGMSGKDRIRSYCTAKRLKSTGRQARRLRQLLEDGRIPS